MTTMAYGIIDPDYARIFTMARVLAWQEGYALLFHGSFTRDLDLIAIPWTASACEPEHLVARVAEAADLNILGKQKAEDTVHGSPKEHGRRAWTLTFKAFGDPRFVDFSVMPRIVRCIRCSGSGHVVITVDNCDYETVACPNCPRSA